MAEAAASPRTSSLLPNSLSWRHINHSRGDDDASLNAINEVKNSKSNISSWLGISDRVADFADTASSVNGTWWWSSVATSLWQRWNHDRDDDDHRHHEPAKAGRGVAQHQSASAALSAAVVPQRMAVDEQITGRLGETFEICRPCTDVEMAHAYCSSDIGEFGI